MRDLGELRQPTKDGAAVVVVSADNMPKVAAVIERRAASRPFGVEHRSWCNRSTDANCLATAASSGRSTFADVYRMREPSVGRPWFGLDMIVRNITDPAIDFLPPQR